MDACQQCGASVSRCDPTCPFCRARNAAYEPVPVEATALFARGMEAMTHARYADAVEAFGRAVAADPEAFDAYFQLSAACDRLGMHERALEATRRAIALRPTSAAMHFNAGIFLLRLGRKAEARASLERAHELARGDPETPNREGFLGYVRAELAKLSGGLSPARGRPRRRAPRALGRPCRRAPRARSAGHRAPSALERSGAELDVSAPRGFYGAPCAKPLFWSCLLDA